ncbi:hypothetical protein H2248_007572 [Termitomyces sp. 'cryptogamus']|nr:hypothetical protein H2248_007572 [Termitomyces sp. 'cryptogamus']
MSTLRRRLPPFIVSRCLSSRFSNSAHTLKDVPLSKRLRALIRSPDETNLEEGLVRQYATEHSQTEHSQNRSGLSPDSAALVLAAKEFLQKRQSRQSSHPHGNNNNASAQPPGPPHTSTPNKEHEPFLESERVLKSFINNLNNLDSPKKKKKKKKKKKQPPPQTQAPDTAYQSLDTLQNSVKETPSGWGRDELQPNQETGENTASTTFLDRSFAPHLPPEPTLSYSRRIEGLIEPTDRPTLLDVEPPSEQHPIARLSHGLDRVLFNPGVHWLQDPRSKVYNFPPYLESIPKVTDFAFERLGGFIKSSRDNDLWELARRENRTFAGSTSSLSGILSHLYFLLSRDKDVNTDNLSRHFGKEPRNFTLGQRMPASVLLNYRDGRYAIDSDSDKEQFADKNILTWMGTLLEKFLTSTPEEFAPYMRFNSPPPTAEKQLRDAYRYSKSEKMVMRSQLDCVDSRLPGTGVFDIKTRACVPIRMDLFNFDENSGYLIRSQTGKLESFEREYYDLIRSAFLKYSFQVRIGNMDGVIVAYHNTARLFGFQYISLQEMDEALFGNGKGVGNMVFDKCVTLLEKVLEEAAACFPGESVKCTFEKMEGEDVMNVWVQQEKPEVPKEVEKEDMGAWSPPTRQLEVRASSFLGQRPVRGSTAVGCVDEPWTVHWSISKLMSSDDDADAALADAKARQFRYIEIPTGLDPHTVEAMFAALNFGGEVQSEETRPTLPSHYFRLPGPRTQELRDISRAGGRETAQKMIEEEGRAKVWLGGIVEWEELQKVYGMLRREEEEAK